MRSFALLPADVWAEITSRLLLLEVYKLAFIVGDSTLRHKLCRGGAITLSHTHRPIPKNEKLIWPAFLADFRPLYRFSVDLLGTNPALDLYLLPSTLREVHISSHCSQWLNVKCTEPSFLQDPRNMLFHANNKTCFNFKTHLPHLSHLHLECPFGFCSPNAIKNLLFMARCLPSNLNSLAMSHLHIVDTRHWKHLPLHSLTRVEPLDLVGLDFLNCLRDYAPMVPVEHITISTSASSLKDFIFPPLLRRITLRLAVASYTREQFLEEIFVLKEVFSQASDNTKSMHKGIDKSSTIVPKLETVVFPQVHPFFGAELPEGLESIWITSSGWSETLFNAVIAPSSLTELRCECKLAHDTLATMTNLTTLNYSRAGAVHIEKSFFDILPPTLRTLELGTRGIADDISEWLPRGLTSLTLKLIPISATGGVLYGLTVQVSKETETLSPAFFESLPQTLTWLSLPNSAFEDVIFVRYAPKTIMQSHAANIFFTGSTVAAGTLQFDMERYFRSPPFRGYLDSPYRDPQSQYEQASRAILASRNLSPVTGIQTEPTLALRLRELPRSLTTLKLCSTYSVPLQQVEILDLPHLTSLSIPLWQHWNWRSKTPSLTQVSILENYHYGQFDRDYRSEAQEGVKFFPPSLTRLQLSKIGGSPDSVAPIVGPYSLNTQLKHLTLKSDLYSDSDVIPEVLSCLESLQTLHMEEYFRVIMRPHWLSLPKTITELKYSNCHYWFAPPVTDLIHTMPMLRSITVHRTEPITDVEELEALCAATSNSCAEDSPKKYPLDLLELNELAIDNLTPYLRAPEDEKCEDPLCEWDWQSRVKSVVLKRFPFLRLPEGSIIRLQHMGKFDGANIRTELTTFYPNLTHLQLGSNVTVHKRFPKWLPPNLISLDVMDARGVDHTTAYYLPDSLTTLHINTRYFHPTAFLQLPRGLKHLFLNNGKFFPRHASKLPPNLETLHTNGLGWGLHTHRHLPKTLKSLKAFYLPDGDLLPRDALPPSLTELFVSHNPDWLEQSFSVPPTLVNFASATDEWTARLKDQICQSHLRTMEQQIAAISHLTLGDYSTRNIMP